MERWTTHRRGVVAALTLTAAGLASVTRAADSKAWSPLDDAIDRALREKVFPGIAMQVNRGDEVLYSRAAGIANIETNTPMSMGSVFRIASNTKQFTAAAILTLQQDGKLSIDDPLAKYMPDFPKADQITLRRLLDHTSGLGSFTSVKLETFLQVMRLDYDDAAILRAIKNANPLFLSEPGTIWNYSNSNYVLLGFVIAQVSGQSYADFLQSRLFGPLGLRQTAVDDAAEIVLHRAAGYTMAKSTPTGFNNAAFISMTYPRGSGSIRSTAPDLCRWMAALMGGRVLHAENLKAMLSPARLKDGSLPPSSNPRAPPGAAGPRYGFGLSLEDVRGHRQAWHQGGISGYFSELRNLPEIDTHLAILVNRDGLGGPPTNPIASAALDLLLQT